MKDRIRELRKKKGISQTQLGQEIGVSSKSISMIENGQNKPTVQQIEELSKFFDVTTDYLIFGIENTKDIEPIEREILRTIRDDRTLYGKLIKMMDAKKSVINSFDNFESLAA
jgi:transcriptional regulator with XRE-family HTH domain